MSLRLVSCSSRRNDRRPRPLGAARRIWHRAPHPRECRTAFRNHTTWAGATAWSSASAPAAHARPSLNTPLAIRGHVHVGAGALRPSLRPDAAASPHPAPRSPTSRTPLSPGRDKADYNQKRIIVNKARGIFSWVDRCSFRALTPASGRDPQPLPLAWRGIP